MKKFLAILMLLAVALPASAKFRWGPTVGADFSHFHWRQNLITSDMRVGFHAGVLGELMIPGIGFGIDFGLQYVNYGGQVNFGEQYIWSSEGIENTNLRLHTLQVPLDLRFKWTRMNGIENYVAPFVFGGPRFNFNVANSKCAAIERNKLSVGLACGLGLELYKRYQISAGYCWNLTDDVHTHLLDDFYAEMHYWMVNFTVLLK